jgi:hypothetical protein
MGHTHLPVPNFWRGICLKKKKLDKQTKKASLTTEKSDTYRNRKIGETLEHKKPAPERNPGAGIKSQNQRSANAMPQNPRLPPQLIRRSFMPQRLQFRDPKKSRRRDNARGID